ncbi:MAG: hypothetical protein ACTSXF_13005 [Promethearchaeota archaeon]
MANDRENERETKIEDKTKDTQEDDIIIEINGKRSDIKTLGEANRTGDNEPYVIDSNRLSNMRSITDLFESNNLKTRNFNRNIGGVVDYNDTADEFSKVGAKDLKKLNNLNGIGRNLLNTGKDPGDLDVLNKISIADQIKRRNKELAIYNKMEFERKLRKSGFSINRLTLILAAIWVIVTILRLILT